MLVASLVLVLAVEALHFHVLVERGVDVLAPLYVQLQVHIRLLPLALVVDVDALDVVDDAALEQLLNRIFHHSALHLLLKLLTQDAVQLLHVVLHEAVVRVPPEARGKLLRCHGRVAVLQLVEQALQSERYAFARLLRLRGGHVVHSLAKVVQVVQCLQQAVHVACRSLILQPDVSRLLVAVVQVRVALLDVHLGKDDERVVV
mmetsp:Transcript_6879/g.15697  ORF Transcript_6879/g.15697 Transcript_6879/m.15697 type:complete len:203 (+) Transcript_6879:215-823(+)